MDILLTLVVVLQVLSALGVIVLVLLQHGKGADMGAAFGSGASGSLFGATGSANFMSRLTGGLATVFFLCTLGLAFVSNKSQQAPSSVMEQPAAAPGDASIPSVSAPAVPAAPASPAPAAGGASSGTDATQKNSSSSEIPK
ncbi:MAG: preprotein translocase subunit SecG [Thauera sp.]